MFLNDDSEEGSSQWTYAFTTFLGTAAILAFIGKTFRGVKLNTEPWDSLDTRAAPKPAPTPAPAASTPSPSKKAPSKKGGKGKK
eukprot:UN01646